MSKEKKPGREKKMVEKYMLERMINKYKKNDVSEVLYRLSYAGKFIFIKGKTLCGSLIILSNTYNYYHPANKKHKNHLYVHFYNHYRRHPGRRFTIKKIYVKPEESSQYELLKREQMELDKHANNPLCLNNQFEPYIPIYNQSTDMYGWLNKMSVLSFKRWQTSKERVAYQKRYCNSMNPKQR